MGTIVGILLIIGVIVIIKDTFALSKQQKQIKKKTEKLTEQITNSKIAGINKAVELCEKREDVLSADSYISASQKRARLKELSIIKQQLIKTKGE